MVFTDDREDINSFALNGTYVGLTPEPECPVSESAVLCHRSRLVNGPAGSSHYPSAVWILFRPQTPQSALSLHRLHRHFGFVFPPGRSYRPHF